MKYDFLVLGASGMQGKIVIRDLLEHGFRVFASSLHKDGLAKLQEKYSRRSRPRPDRGAKLT